MHRVYLREKNFFPSKFEEERLHLTPGMSADWALGKRGSNAVKTTKQLLVRALRSVVLPGKGY